MPCAACARKRGGPALFNEDGNATGDPTVWGPVLWQMLHIFAEHIGDHGIDADQARDFEVVVTMLPQILPCADCQAHSRTYLQAHPFEANKNAKVPGTLAPYVQTWLLTFHNAVRTQNDQPIEITTLAELHALYAGKTVTKEQLGTLSANANYGIRTGLLKTDVWKRWYIIFNRLKVISGQ